MRSAGIKNLILKAVRSVERTIAWIAVNTALRSKREELSHVLDFFTNHQDFRSLDACSETTGIERLRCYIYREYLYGKNMLGLYHYGRNTQPQSYMRDIVLKKFPAISKESFILEVGPGEYPVFNYEEYTNWYGVDKTTLEDRDRRPLKTIAPDNHILLKTSLTIIL